MKTSTLVLAVIALCACSDHTYEAVGFFQFQTLAEETSVYDAVAKIAPKVGYA